MEESPLVSIVIVTYNSEDEIIGCLNSIFDSNISVVVYVVDNASSDNTKLLLKQYTQKESRLKLILNEDNKGLAAANNQPLPFIESKYTLILNPDILLQKDSISLMLEGIEADKKIGMLGPLSLFEDGEEHVSSNASYGLFTIVAWRLVPHTVMRFFFDRYSDFKTTRDVAFVSGACYLIPTKLFKELNGYDPAYFLTISDVADIGVRIRKRGYRAVYYPKAVITHFSGRSNAPLKYLTQYWGLTGDLYFIRKHMGPIQFAFAKTLFVVGSVIRGCVFLVIAGVTKKETYKEKVKLYFDLAKSVKSFVPLVRKED